MQKARMLRNAAPPLICLPASSPRIETGRRETAATLANPSPRPYGERVRVRGSAD
jgi:hypothetical protein